MNWSPERRAKLVALGKWHSEWTRRNLAQAAFEPEGRKAGSDYNQHHLTVSATPEQDDEYWARANEIMGLDPETGRPAE